MAKKTSRNSSPHAGLNPAITPSQELPPELLQLLSALGIAPDLIPRPDGEFVGISHASGPQEDQAELDAWIEAGGIPEFKDSGR